MENQTIKLTLSRKRMLSAAFRSFDIYVNGECVGKLKNGKTITAEITKQNDYIFDVDFPFFHPRVLSDHEGDELDVRMEIIGGNGSPLEPTFLTRKFGEYHPLDDADYSWDLLTEDSELDLLDEPRRILGLCMIFWDAVTKSPAELLFLPRLTEIFNTLRAVGANGYADAIAKLTEEFHDVSLPLAKEQILSDKTFLQRLRAAHNIIRELENQSKPGIIEEFHRAVTQHILTYRLFGV